MGEYLFTEKGFEHDLFWQTQDRKTLRRINDLLKSIDREGPLQGIGKPEALRYRVGAYSRRIDDANRLVYEVKDGKIVIQSCRGHYDD